MWIEKCSLKKQLIGTTYEIWQDKARAADDGGEASWFAAYEAEWKLQNGETETERCLRVKVWEKAHKPTGRNAEALKWFKQYEQLRNCQAQWVGYRAECCGASTRPIAVPIGCGHRLCPLCSSHRAQGAKKRIRTMFDRLTHPVMLTLTTPNKGTIRKHDFTLMRQRVRKFLKQNEAWIRGGVYSLETTYNRREKTWHLHCHILADVCSPLPSKKEMTILAGERVCSFTAIKLKLEFDWLRLWGPAWGKKPRKDADPMKKNGEVFTFESWVRQGREMRLREWRDGAFQAVEGISESERAQRTAWNRANRRVVDVRPVTDRNGAAREVLKYITKCADFSDLPEAVEPFMNAVKGARLIQTFGTWFGVSLDTSTDFDPEHFEDWGEMKCTCGQNAWKRMGVFYRDEVEMDVSGRWYLNAHISHTCSGTVPRPTIRALDRREE